MTGTFTQTALIMRNHETKLLSAVTTLTVGDTIVEIDFAQDRAECILGTMLWQQFQNGDTLIRRGMVESEWEG